MPASLYTRVARPCAPCPRHAHVGPRDHSYPRPPAPPDELFVMPPAPVRKVTPPMSGEKRIRVYRDQSRGRLTKRQLRQMARQFARTQIAEKP